MYIISYKSSIEDRKKKCFAINYIEIWTKMMIT